jgi:hypothetical protein
MIPNKIERKGNLGFAFLEDRLKPGRYAVTTPRPASRNVSLIGARAGYQQYNFQFQFGYALWVVVRSRHPC